MRLPWRREGPPGDIDCRQVARVLQTHLDGELDRATARRVAAHLEDCRRCGMEAATYRELKRRLADASEPVDPAAVARLRAFVDGLSEPTDA